MATNSPSSFSPLTRNSSYNIEGIVIKRSNLGEADKLVTVFTKSQGKITLKAKSLRKLSSKRAGSLELFNQVKASVVRGRGGLDILAEVQLLNSFSGWRKHLGRVTLAYQICEAVDKLTPDNQPHPEVYELLQNSLLEIDKLGLDWKLVIGTWLIELVSELGYWPREKKFDSDIYEFIENIASRPMNSHKLFPKLSHT